MSPTIEDQIALEKTMVAHGVSRYKHSIGAAEGNDRTADTRYAQKLMREFVIPVADALEEYCGTTRPGVQGKYRALLRRIDPDVAAFLSLRSVFNSFLKSPKVVSVASNIGQMLEDELKFSVFREEEGEYYEAIIEDFRRKGTKNYRHMHRVLTMKANEKEISWVSWTQEERVGVGMKMLDLMMETTDLLVKTTVYERNKTVVLIEPSPEVLDWVRRFNEYAALLYPDRMPCIIPPDEWSDLDQGGYYTPQMRRRSPMVKTREQCHRDMFAGDITNITEALNALQNTAWTVNEKVFNVLKLAWDMALPIGLPRSEPYIIPASPVQGKAKETFSKREKEAFEAWKEEARAIHTLEKDRVSKCFEIVRLVRLATQYREYDQFWFVYQCDFRGRMYCTTSGLSPQGTDPAKGCLLFAEGKRLGKDGAKWLKVHGANCYGIDKVSFDDRIKWVHDNKDAILAVAADPLSHTQFWGDADSPWQFLAFCFEYDQFCREGFGMISHLPIGMDGSCNGLQHFSAMLRDEVGGKATNLLPGLLPSDIYAEVGRVCYGKLGDAEMDRLWKKLSADGLSLPRSLAKKPVMTLPYGSTRQTCTAALYAFLRENGEGLFDTRDMFRMAIHLTPILWESIGDTVVAARAAMDWIQDCASVKAKVNEPLIWWTPIGFPVYQGTRKVKTKKIDTELCGRFQIRIGEFGDTLDVLKNRQGSSPNFVHSMDACHAMLTLLRADQYGIQSFAFVHDSFACLAADVEDLNLALRETFVEMYEENDPLLDFKLSNENDKIKLPELPPVGGLNLEEVLDSEYFFS